MNQKGTRMIENLPHSPNFKFCCSLLSNLSISNKNENLKMFVSAKNKFLNLIIRNHFDS